ncbi:RNA polymerase sigma factor [Bosea rubneri]|uniref:RNA polymerase sigma factor n=1 Tax=Bosea rubneri TaxID=3075434 RepID=A0ABU3S4L1_9HYPH|nr:RNA polymerase sigma factor [Bosea sp. ZW T0_25]MDU0339713.1 RNA polymerase sigma factor [Bosea sp. ZW T0_25]
MSASDTHRTIEAVFRIEAPKLIAGLARVTRDVGRAEELAQDALVAALQQWPGEGVPRNPGAWLMQAARHRALDGLRRDKMLKRKHEEIGRDLDEEADPIVEIEEALDDEVGDDLLRLIFTACHPVLAVEARLALTLRLIGGLTTEEIARAFLVPEPTMAQRLVRAKKALAEAKVPYEVPHGPELAERLGSVLEVVYLIFNEGYSATAGEDWVRPGLCQEAMRLGRILAGLAPQEPEVHGLVALMELQASRLRARIGQDGQPVLLLDQNRALWDHLLINHGLKALETARALAPSPGSYVLQAELAACHARARRAEDTDWARIAALYGALGALTPSPVIELNRAVAVAMAEGPAAGLVLVDALASAPALKNYHLLPSVRADLLGKLGRHGEAQAEFIRAAGMTRNQREQALLLARAEKAGVAGKGESIGPKSGSHFSGESDA